MNHLAKAESLAIILHAGTSHGNGQRFRGKTRSAARERSSVIGSVRPEARLVDPPTSGKYFANSVELGSMQAVKRNHSCVKALVLAPLQLSTISAAHIAARQPPQQLSVVGGKRLREGSLCSWGTERLYSGPLF